MNKTFIAIIIIALVAVAFLYKTSVPQVEAPLTEQKQEEKKVVAPKEVVSVKPTTPKKVVTSPVVEIPRLVVSYTDQGFSPSIREVNKGEEVTFVNNSSTGMRLASFERDGQGKYTGLSQPKTVSRGEIFKFVFLQAGSWNYRNLNNQSHTGIVVVK